MSVSRDEEIYDAVCHIHRTYPLTSGRPEHVVDICQLRRAAIDAQFAVPRENSLAHIYDQQMLQRELNDVPQEKSSRTAEQEDPPPEGSRYETWQVMHEDETLGDYVTFVKLLDRGATSEVWLAKSRYNTRSMAIKMVNSEAFSDKVQVALALAELQNLFRITHPNIVQIYNAGKIRSRNGEEAPFVLMEFVKGQKLEDVVRDRRKSPDTSPALLRQVASIVATLARALHFLHCEANEDGTPVYHQDVKPANVMIDDDGVIKLIDFGSLGLTASLGQIGTREYMAPERMKPNADASAGWDIFGLGGVLYYLVTGKHPFLEKDGTLLPTVKWPAWTDSVNLGDPDLTLICRKCLSFSTSQRYSTAKELEEDLTAWLGQYPLPHVRKNGYSWHTLEVMRLRRARQSNDIIDHSQIIARVFLLDALAVIVMAVAHFFMVWSGIPRNEAFVYASSGTIGVVLLLFVGGAYLVRFNRVILRMLEPISALVIAMLIVLGLVLPSRIGVFPSWDEIIHGTYFVVIMIALVTITLSTSTPDWRFLRVLGWTQFLLAIAVRPILDVPGVAAYMPVLGSLLDFSGCATFMFFILSRPSKVKTVAA
jgi:serine/threonine protein kinase